MIRLEKLTWDNYDDTTYEWRPLRPWIELV